MYLNWNSKLLPITSLKILKIPKRIVNMKITERDNLDKVFETVSHIKKSKNFKLIAIRC